LTPTKPRSRPHLAIGSTDPIGGLAAAPLPPKGFSDRPGDGGLTPTKPRSRPDLAIGITDCVGGLEAAPAELAPDHFCPRTRAGKSRLAAGKFRLANREADRRRSVVDHCSARSAPPTVGANRPRTSDCASRLGISAARSAAPKACIIAGIASGSVLPAFRGESGPRLGGGKMSERSSAKSASSKSGLCACNPSKSSSFTSSLQLAATPGTLSGMVGLVPSCLFRETYDHLCMACMCERGPGYA
jgi:hypothetical protein